MHIMMRHTLFLCSAFFLGSAYGMDSPEKETPHNEETYVLDDALACLNECLEDLKAPEVLHKALELLQESEQLRTQYLSNALKQSGLKRPYEATLIRYSLNHTPNFMPKNRKDIAALKRTSKELEERSLKRAKQMRRLIAAQECDEQIQEHIAALLDTHDRSL